MTGTVIELQEFCPENAVSLDDGRAAARDAEYQRGFADGARASAEEHAETQDQLRSALLETLQDGQQTQREMEAAAIRGLTSLAGALVRHLAPHLAEAGLAERVGDALADALAARPDAMPRIRCAADTAAALEAALTGAWHGRFQIDIDPRLTPLEAELHWADGFDAIDPGAALAAIAADLDALAGRAPADDPETPEDLSHAG